MSRPNKLLLKWRKDRDISQAAAGKLVNPSVSQATWAAWESDDKAPSIHNAFEIERLTEGAIAVSSWARLPKRQRIGARAKSAKTKAAA